MKVLNSPEGLDFLAEMQSTIKSHLIQVNLEIGVKSSPELEGLLDRLSMAREIHESGSDAIHNDIFILEKYVAFFRAYGRLWREISERHHSESWLVLQNANDALRLIRKFSGLRLPYLASQLRALESLYPYEIFASCGFVVESFECSICGNDIDSFECCHRKGELYRGKMACGIAKNILALDHISLVTNPSDKRCVVKIPDEAPGFSGIRFLGDAFNQRRILVSNFGGVAWKKKLIPNSMYTRTGRNEHCSCRSGKKFKHCCIDKEFRQADHAEILLVRSIFERSGLA